MSLAHFSVWYNVADKNYEPTSSRAQPRYELKNDLGKIYLRRKQACLRIPTITQESHGDSYYYHLLFLYLPWRNETLDLIGNHQSAQASFVANKDKLQVLSSEQHSSFADEVQRATEQLRVLNQCGDALYAPVAPCTSHVNLENNNEGDGHDPIYDHELYLDDVAAMLPDDNNDHNNHLCGQNIEQNIGDIEDALTLDSISRRRFSDSEFEARIASLNDSQRVPYEKILEYSRGVHDFQMKIRESMPSPFRMFITGGAGTGKSHVISVIKEHLERAHIGAGNACVLMAPTGVAAFNIGGLTIHRALNLPVEHGNSTTYRKLGAERLKELRQSWKYVNTIIIDEISMVSYKTMSFIHKRLTEIKGTDDTEVLFGGLNVIAVGDFFQLPPVRDKFVFEDGRGYHQGSTHLWRDEFKLIELTQNMRQRGDTEYSEILNCVRIGSQTKADISVLRSRLTSGISHPIDVSQPPFVDALRLLPLKEQVEEYNESRLKDLSHSTKIYEFDAEHSIVESTKLIPGVVSHQQVPESLIPSSDRDCAGLSRKVKLAIGAQVMLRRNIICEKGLVNGARGIIVGFSWPNGTNDQAKKGDLPQKVCKIS